jgi:hypothetical protein
MVKSNFFQADDVDVYHERGGVGQPDDPRSPPPPAIAAAAAPVYGIFRRQKRQRNIDAGIPAMEGIPANAGASQATAICIDD